jgi:hypothetical protein
MLENSNIKVGCAVVDEFDNIYLIVDLWDCFGAISMASLILFQTGDTLEELILGMEEVMTISQIVPPEKVSINLE